MDRFGGRFLIRMIKILFALFIALAFFHSVFNQTLDKARLDQLFDRLAEKNKAMGTLTVARDGNILYTRSIGHSVINGTEKKAASAQTRYRVGSVTKLFTATMVFQLIEEGKLKLTDTLDKFFPHIPNAQKITIGHLLAHRSGVRDLTRNPDFRNWKSTAKTQDEMLAIIGKGAPDFEPGEKYAYSNSGYVLLGYIVEKAGGKPYGDALKQRITSKIGLKDTYLGAGKTDPAKSESHSYRYARDWELLPETDLSIPGGGGAIVSTSADLTRFAHALFNYKLVSQASLDQMKTINDGYGYGVEAIPLGGRTLIGHTGRIDDFNSILAYLPEEKLAIAYTSNGMVYPAANIVGGVFEIAQNKPFEIPAFATVAVSPQVLDKYVGRYSTTQAPMKLTVTRENSGLLVQPNGQSALPLEALAQDRFQVESVGVVLEFDAAKNQMTFKQRGRELVFTKEN